MQIKEERQKNCKLKLYADIRFWKIIKINSKTYEQV